MRISRVSLLAAVITSSFLFGNSAAAETLRIGGTGAATAMMQHLGIVFANQSEVKVDVIPSLGTSGAIRALTEGVLDVAISGRALKPEEAASGIIAAASVRTPFGLVTSHRNPNGLKAGEIADIFRNEKATWRDGTPIRIILRPKSESDTALLGELFPGLVEAIATARLRADVPVAATAQDNADLAERITGSLIGASYTQIKMEKRALRMIAIDDVEPNLENFETGTYDYSQTLYFIVPAKMSAAAERFIAFLLSPEGKIFLRETGNLSGTRK